MDGMLEVYRMDQIDRDVSTEAAIVFVDSYYDELRVLSKDREQLVKIFKNAFVKEAFYVALMDGEVAGILACSNNRMRALHLEKDDVIRHLGTIKGNFIYMFFDKEFHTPLSYNDSTAYIEAVATHLQARGKGVATRLVEHVLKKLPYTEYRLTVKDTNKGAISIYQRLGFKSFDKLKASFFERKFYNYKYYMKLTQTAEIKEPTYQRIEMEEIELSRSKKQTNDELATTTETTTPRLTLQKSQLSNISNEETATSTLRKTRSA